MASLTGRDKFSRIQDLIDWGFNAPVYTKIHTALFSGDDSPRYNNPPEPADIIYIIAGINKWDRVSIRVNKSIGGAKVAFINKKPEDLYKLNDILAEEFFDNKHDLIIASGLPPTDLFSGCIEVLQDNSFILEVIINGPVRDLTHGKKTPHIRIVGNFESDRWRFHPEFDLVQALATINRLGPVGHTIYEFSTFDFPVGCKNEQVIFWEYEEINNGRHKKRQEGIFSSSIWGDFKSNLFKTEGAS